jgi:hypothetical protein
MASPQIAAHPALPVYSDTVDGSSIRLLRFSQSEDGEFVGTLRTFLLANAPHFYTVSLVIQALPLWLIISGELCVGHARIRKDQPSFENGVFASPAQSCSLLAYGDTAY